MKFVLENELCRVICQEKGGEIASFFDKEKNVELMYQGNQGWSGKNPTLFPLVGNTYNKQYEIHGKTYAMKNHGLIRYATLKGEKRDNHLVFVLDADEQTKALYPFDFHYEIEYTLEGKKLIIQYRITNTSHEDMPFSFGLHPGFNVPQKEGETFEEYTLDFEKHEEANQLLFDAKCEHPIEYQKVSMDRWPLSHEEVEKYSTIIYKDLVSDYVTLMYKNEPRLRVSCKGYPYLALWTHENRSDFLCIEPWYGHGDFEKTNVDFYHREGTIVLKPQSVFETGYTIESM